MGNSFEIVEEQKKKSSRRKYIIAAGIIFLLITPVLIVISLMRQGDPASEKIILEAAAKQLNKNLNDLTDEDFLKIKVFEIRDAKLSDIKAIEKFTNLQELRLYNIYSPENEIPKWAMILAKYGFYNIEKRKLIDLMPLKKLNKLQKLECCIAIPVIGELEAINFILSSIKYSPFQNISPLSNLNNLKELNLKGTNISNLKPIKKLIKLQELNIQNCKNITDKQVEDLQKALPNLKISR